MRTPFISAGILIGAALLLIGCSSGTPSLKVSDILQIRLVTPDDPLGARFRADDGTEVRTGDAVVNDARVWTATVGKGKDEGSFDLTVRLREADAARWRSFAQRRKGQQAVVLIDGKVLATFTIERIPEEEVNTKIIVSNVAASKEAADLLSTRLDAIKTPMIPVQEK
jgi:hypothetical protein